MLFRSYDGNKDGFLTRAEFRQLLKDDQTISASQIGTFIDLVDKNGDDHISFDEFCRAMKGSLDFDTITEASAKRLFYTYDRDRNGYMSLTEFLDFYEVFTGRIDYSFWKDHFSSDYGPRGMPLSGKSNIYLRKDAF